MNQKAKENGVEIWEGAKVTGVVPQEGDCTVTFRRGEKQQSIKAGFVIGADGAVSVVRKSLFPNLKALYAKSTRECYEGSLEIEKEYVHWFFPRSRPRPRFDLCHKGEFFLLEGRNLSELKGEVRRLLADHGFDPARKPVWKDGGTVAILHDELFSGSFLPARGNIMLIGDAAGLILPITFEGIGSTLKSGVLAADAIIHGVQRRTEAAEFYIRKLEPVLEALRRVYKLNEELDHATARGAIELSKSLKRAYEQALTVV